LSHGAEKRRKKTDLAGLEPTTVQIKEKSLKKKLSKWVSANDNWGEKGTE